MRYFFLILPVTLFACVTEGDRQVNYQTLGAGQRLLKIANTTIGLASATAAEIKQIAFDVIENSKMLLKTQGNPAVQLPYTAENAAMARQRALNEFEEPGFLGTIVDSLKTPFPWAAAALTMAWGFYRKIRQGREVIETLVQGGEEVKSMDPAKAELVEAKMKEVAIRNGNYNLVRQHVRAAKKKRVADSIPKT